MTERWKYEKWWSKGPFAIGFDRWMTGAGWGRKDGSMAYIWMGLFHVAFDWYYFCPETVEAEDDWS